MDHVETIGRFTVYWDRGIGRFVVYSSTDEMVYTQPATHILDGIPTMHGLSALQWARQRERVIARIFGDVEPGYEFE